MGMKGSLANIKRGVALALAIMLPHIIAAAQGAASGALRGAVFDARGDLIVGATVTVVDANGREKTTVSNASGLYLISSLAAGTYTVRASAPGFAGSENADVVITTGRAVALNITLNVT